MKGTKLVWTWKKVMISIIHWSIITIVITAELIMDYFLSPVNFQWRIHKSHVEGLAFGSFLLLELRRKPHWTTLCAEGWASLLHQMLRNSFCKHLRGVQYNHWNWFQGEWWSRVISELSLLNWFPFVFINRTWATKTNTGMKRVSCAICAAFHSSTNSLDRKLIRFTAATATTLNSPRDVTDVVKSFVPVSARLSPKISSDSYANWKAFLRKSRFLMSGFTMSWV